MKSNLRKAVFFDIDGTLWDEHMQVPKSTITAIHRLRECGNLAFICTGRSRSTVRAKELLEDIGFDGIVAGCGTHVEYLGNVIFETKLSQEEIPELLQILEKYHMPPVLEGRQYLHADEEKFGEDPYIAYLKRVVKEDFLPLEGYMGRFDANKISADYTNGDKMGLKKALEERYELIFHAQKVVEIVPKGFSKASGIREICKYLNVSQENTYAFGDSANDVEMLRYVKHGIAMGNATADAMEAADYVTTSIREDGIYQGLKHFLLI